MKYDKKYLEKINKWYKFDSNYDYLSRHPELERFDMPKTFYFRYLPDRGEIHWAIIVPKGNEHWSPVNVYFINNWGRVFDKLEFKNAKIARRRLRRNGFDFSTNRYCPFTPPEPIYILLSCGKKSAPYSNGNLWQSVQRDKKHIDKIENTCIKQKVTFYELQKGWIYQEKMGAPANVYKTMIEQNLPATKVLEMWGNGEIPTENNELTKQSFIPKYKPDIKKCSNYATIILIILVLLVLILTILGY